MGGAQQPGAPEAQRRGSAQGLERGALAEIRVWLQVLSSSLQEICGDNMITVLEEERPERSHCPVHSVLMSVSYTSTQQVPSHSAAHLKPRQHCKSSLCAGSRQLCPTLRNPMDCSPPGSSAHGILQAIIREWVAWVACSPPGDLPDSGIEPTSLMSSCIGRWVLYHSCRTTA